MLIINKFFNLINKLCLLIKISYNFNKFNNIYDFQKLYGLCPL